MTRISILFLFIFSLTYYSCSNYSKISSVDVAQAYSPERSKLHPDLYVTHSDDGYSHVNIEIPSSELLYVQKATDNFYTARFQVKLQLWDADNENVFLFQMDSTFTDTLQNDLLRIIRQPVKIPMALGKDYFIHVRFEDLQKRRTADRIIQTDKSSIYSRGFFSFANEDHGKNFQNPFEFPTNKKVTINHSTRKDFPVWVRKIIYTDEIPSPPFTSQYAHFDNFNTWETDTAITVFFDQTGTTPIELPKYGLYHFYEPENPDSGFLVMNFWPNFPELPNDENTLKPLRYITTQQEFENLFTFDDPTLAMERFWTKITGNPDRASSVQNRYNQRVEESNKYFSSFLPGWQTDRGMVYIVFGPPAKVILNSSGENWYYDEQLNIPGLHFEFFKYENPFSATHMVLKRNPTYQNSWNIALERWRR